MSGNYVSPYGFGPVMDAVLDCVADRHDRSSDYLAVAMERLPEEVTEELNLRIEGTWTTHLGPAVDALDDLLSEYVDLEHGRETVETAGILRDGEVTHTHGGPDGS